MQCNMEGSSGFESSAKNKKGVCVFASIRQDFKSSSFDVPNLNKGVTKKSENITLRFQRPGAGPPKITSFKCQANPSTVKHFTTWRVWLKHQQATERTAA